VSTSVLSFVLAMVCWILMLHYFNTNTANTIYRVLSYSMGGISAVYSLSVLFYGGCLVRTLSKVKGRMGGANRKKRPNYTSNTNGNSNSNTTTKNSDNTHDPNSKSGHDDDDDDTDEGEPVEKKGPSGMCRYVICFKCLFCFWDVTSTQRLLYGAIMFSATFAALSLLLIGSVANVEYNQDLGYSPSSILIEFLFWLSFVIMLWLFTAGVTALNPAIKKKEEARQAKRRERQAERDRASAKREREMAKETRKKEKERSHAAEEGIPQLVGGGSMSSGNTTRDSTVSAASASVVSKTISKATIGSASRKESTVTDIELADAPKLTS